MPTDSSTVTENGVNPDIAAVAGVAQRVIAAWAAQDGDAFAEIFTENGSMVLPGSIFQTSREGIRAFMKGAFQGPYKGTQVTGAPLGVRFITPDVAVMITKGGVMLAGETEVAPDRQVKATWVVVREGDGWQLAAYHNSPSSD